MIIELTGTSTRNKGAELMAVAVVRHFESAHHEVQLAVGTRFGSYADRAKYGLLHKVEFRRFGRAKLGCRLLPEAFRRHCGIVHDGEIDAIVDASGFAFGDQLPQATARHFAAQVERWQKSGKPIVMLPQALGPFRTPECRKLFRQIAGGANLLYARDVDSHGFACEAAPEFAERIHLAPDITVALDAEMWSPTPPPVPARAAAIVPNSRMLDRTDSAVAEAYLPFLGRCVRMAEAEGLAPFLLIHDDGEDEELVGPLEAATGKTLRVLRESDPLRLKKILSDSTIVIGSRFHALVGALASGVPALAAGWSHKYERLFEDFNCPQWVIDVGGSTEDTLAAKIRDAVAQSRRGTNGPLYEAKARMSAQLEKMWCEVEAVLGLGVS